MSLRIVNLIALALVVGLAAGCAPGGPSVHPASGFLPGMADGFLILFQFFGGHLTDPEYFAHLREGTSYALGYLSGAIAFFAAGTMCSLP